MENAGLTQKQWLLLVFAFCLGIASMFALNNTLFSQNLPQMTVQEVSTPKK